MADWKSLKFSWMKYYWIAQKNIKLNEYFISQIHVWMCIIACLSHIHISNFNHNLVFSQLYSDNSHFHTNHNSTMELIEEPPHIHIMMMMLSGRMIMFCVCMAVWRPKAWYVNNKIKMSKTYFPNYIHTKKERTKKNSSLITHNTYPEPDAVVSLNIIFHLIYFRIRIIEKWIFISGNASVCVWMCVLMAYGHGL